MAQEALLGPLHCDLIATKSSLVETLCQTGDWKEAYVLAKDVLEAYITILPPHFPRIGVQHYMCAKIAMWDDALSTNAATHLNQAACISTLWHGAEHRFTQRALHDLAVCQHQLRNNNKT
jgi:hypothetical protein